MKLFIAYGFGNHHKTYFDEGMKLFYIRETTIKEVESWNQVFYKDWYDATPVSLEKFNEKSDDYTRMQIRRFTNSEFLRRIELYVLAKDINDATEFVTDKFNKCWSRW